MSPHKTHLSIRSFGNSTDKVSETNSGVLVTYYARASAFPFRGCRLSFCDHYSLLRKRKRSVKPPWRGVRRLSIVLRLPTCCHGSVTSVCVLCFRVQSVDFTTDNVFVIV